MKLRFLTMATLLLAAACISCNKGRPDHKSAVKNVTLNVTLGTSQLYTLDVSQYGDEDDLASISSQAVAYTTSTLQRDVTGRYIYHYQFDAAGGAKTGSTGSDQVVLKVYEPAGRCRSHDETIISIHFTIQ